MKSLIGIRNVRLLPRVRCLRLLLGDGEFQGSVRDYLGIESLVYFIAKGICNEHGVGSKKVCCETVEM